MSCQREEPPLVKGGQGRSAGNIRSDLAGYIWTIVFLTFLGAIVVQGLQS